ncbi:hypothetical protein SCHPADRAFT_908894 [Schizopora paradoxa]|uniref:Uncharacterized protein n=1 Tax=Schizopora paradoxa TaxID=27342 RepID=A0A0H2REY6_9AGAM|nr:hypothetical protein SCHPADRAFT_908894 [Schizopora paradoxa]
MKSCISSMRRSTNHPVLYFRKRPVGIHSMCLIERFYTLSAVWLSPPADACTLTKR